MVRRFCRLEPPYLISIFIVLALWELSSRAAGFTGATPWYSLGQVLSHLFYLIPFSQYEWLNVVYWTLAYEFLFYMLVGVLWPYFSRKHIAVTFLVVCAIFTLLWVARTPGRELVFLFFLGICGVRYFVYMDKLRDFALFSLLTVGVLCWLSDVVVAVIALCSLTTIVFLKIPRYRVLSFFGMISYSLYLLHVPIGGRVVNLGRRFGDGPVYDLLLSGFALLMCLAAATIFYWIVEGPAQRLSRRVSLGARRAGEPVRISQMR